MKPPLIRAAVLLFAAMLSCAGSTAMPAEPLLYENGPQQIFQSKCRRCHGDDRANRKAELNLQTIAGVRRGSATGAVVVSGNLDQSLLWKKVSSGAMPPGEKNRLSADELEMLRAWIAQGAKSKEPLSETTSAVTDEERAFWSFQPLVRPPVPSVKEGDAAATPVDSFLLSRLEQQELAFSPPADKQVLIRRLSFDLLGLPPTPEEVGEFIADTAPDAYARLVDRLLASPHNGERWGRHWLDVAGYSDSNGYHRADTPRPLAYRYRDYVVRAINDDKPYDRFWIEQLAGDELFDLDRLDGITPEVTDALVATHFLRNAPDGTDSTEGNEMVRTIERYAVLEQQLQITISAMFGLTIDCARCHSHKFDPIPQTDYYALQAVFYPAFNVKEWVPPAERSIHMATPQQMADWEAGTQRTDAAIAALKQNLAAWAAQNRPRAELLFADDFNSRDSKPLLLALRWTNTAPGDDAPAGTIGVNVDSTTAPGAQIENEMLRIIEAGNESSGWLATAQSFDWTPNETGAWIQATFDLVDDKLKAGDTAAARIGFYLGLHDYNDNGGLPGGNILIDGNPAGGAAVAVDYPGSDSQSAGQIGTSGFTPGRNYGVRVTNLGDGRFQLEQLVDLAPEEKAATLTGEQLRDGAFGFEFCCGRSFVVDNVVIEQSVSTPQATAAAFGRYADELRKKQAETETAVKEAESRRPEKPGRIAWVSDLSPEAPEVPLLKRGRYFDPGPPVAPAGLSVLSRPDARFEPAARENAKTTGRRLAFAQWGTGQSASARTPGNAAALLARVQVNRVWMWHFGRGLVETPGNFGALGLRPSHPELLNWLASEYVESGWSLKHLQRLIVLSSAFRQSTVPTAHALAVDPDDRLLWGFPPRRLESEAVRDAMLAVAGLMNGTMGGPAVEFTELPDRQVVVPVSRAAGLSEGNRRSLYLRQRRSTPVTFLQTFDQAAAEPNCLERSTSAVVSQALALLNSQFAVDAAQAFADRVRQTAGADRAVQVQLAYRVAYAREPAPAELQRVLTFLDSQQRIYLSRDQATEPQAAHLALGDFCQTLLASNEFLYQQ